MALTLTSSAFQAGGKIPSKYTCEGDDISPPLAIDDVPAGAKSLALIVDDPDAPDPKAPKRVWVHWVVYNLPPDTKGLPENAGEQGFAEGRRDRARTTASRTPITVRVRRSDAIAISISSTRSISRCRHAPLTKAGARGRDAGHVLAQAELMATYQKGDP